MTDNPVYRAAQKHLEDVMRLHESHFGTQLQQNLARRLGEEKARAAADMAEKYANLHMPEDIRSRARSWGMEAFCDVLWNNAFQAGYREAMRDREKDTTHD